MLNFIDFNADKVTASHKEFLDLQKSDMNIYYKNLSIQAWFGIYHPVEASSTLFVLKNLPNIRNQKILDLGCGTGLIGLVLALNENKVTMSDINPMAVKCAQNNARLNNVNVEIVESDLFNNINNQKFDCIIFNTPYWHRNLIEEVEILACDEGGKVFKRFIELLPLYLNQSGVAFFTYSNLSSQNLFKTILKEYSMKFEIIAQETEDNLNIVRWLIKAQNN